MTDQPQQRDGLHSMAANPRRAFLAIQDQDGKVYALDIDCRDADVSLELDRSFGSFGNMFAINFRASNALPSNVGNWSPPDGWGGRDVERAS